MGRSKHQRAAVKKAPSYKPGPDPVRPLTETPCPHCKATTQTGLHGGCGSCGRVKTSTSGKRRAL